MSLERISTVVLLGLSVVVCALSASIGIGSLNNPGSGFLPFVAGLLFGLLSLSQMLKVWFSKETKGEFKTKDKVNKEGLRSFENLRRIAFVFACLLAYILVIRKLGYLISTFLFMVFLFRVSNLMKWWSIVVISLVITLGTYFVFDQWLSGQFPKGIFPGWR